MKLARLPFGRVVHLINARGVSVCGRTRRYAPWLTEPRMLDGYPRCKLCAKGDRLRMPT